MKLMGTLILILGWLESILLFALIARFIAAIFSSKSRKIVRENPTRHVLWTLIVVVLLVVLATLPNYMGRKFRLERTKQLIESLEHGLRADTRFERVGINARHYHFLSVTGMVDSLKDKMALLDLIQPNRIHAPVPMNIDVIVSTNLNN